MISKWNGKIWKTRALIQYYPDRYVFTHLIKNW